MTRARPRPDQLDFVTGELDGLRDRMTDLAATGTGWVNIRPVIDPDDEPPPPGLFAIFGGSVHKVPTATWMPGKRVANGTAKPTTVGLQHAAGPRVVAKLAGLGLPLPDGWRVTQDHPRRGLVAHVPPDASPAVTMDWLVRAASVVCAVPITGRWTASIHAGTTSSGPPIR